MTSMATFKTQLQFKGHHQRITDIKVVQENGKPIIYSSSRDKLIKGWEFVKDQTGELHGKEYRIYKKHDGFINEFGFSHDQKKLISVGDDKMIRVWSEGELLATVPAPGNKKPKCILTHVHKTGGESEQEYIFTGGEDATVHIWNGKLELKGSLVRPDNLFSGVTSIKADPKRSEMIICAYEDGQIVIWNIETEQPVRTIDVEPIVIDKMEVSPDGSLCAIVGRDKKVYLQDLKGKNTRCEIAISDSVHCFEFAKSAYWLTVGTDNGVVVWDILGKDIVIEIPRPPNTKEMCTSIFWDEGFNILAGYSDGSIQYSLISK
ncbi:guanine nucleotide-binding protein subunit beta-2-like 1 protein [Nematocida sp. AWRm77]|nr:guanine nucleotide-binding protein subunit beta-2-like 1 protein [Nematocida sp. AWRm77]